MYIQLIQIPIIIKIIGTCVKVLQYLSPFLVLIIISFGIQTNYSSGTEYSATADIIANYKTMSTDNVIQNPSMTFLE